MTMKPSSLGLLFVVVFLVALSVTQAGELFLEITGNSNATYRINGRSATQSQLASLLGKLGSANTLVYAFCDNGVAPAQFVAAVSTMQEFGFRYVLLVCEGSQGGTNGTYLVTIDCAKYGFGEDCGYGGSRWGSGFYADKKQVPPVVEEWLERRKNAPAGEKDSSGKK